ncbi:Rap1-interacting factor 1 N terminal-domain-containing protein [Aspergillus karnatakaensis]|uniref:putative telomere length regulator protein (Rif1) n=1 Tax=Aspergillus karnatakaensis TaxID=1810916 RepID=UPI003CCCC9F4
MVDVLAPLSARPPTPPRTASRMLSEKNRTEDSPVTVQTPVDSPFQHNNSTGAPSSRQSKRVNFSPWPNFIKAPSFTNTKSKALLPSNDRKPSRSILKATSSPAPVGSVDIISYTPETFTMLLESITKQLAGESISSRIDAYMQFFEEEIVRKLGLISQFIQRDINRDITKDNPLDTNLIIQALKLSVVLVWHPQIAPQLPDEFKLFLVEHSISCLENGDLPKSVMTHYLSVLSTQKFQTKIITASRITRLLEMLHSLTDKVKGNSVVSQRLLIYERLFELSKSAFIAQSALWMDHLISGLLHQIKDVRLKALELGFNAYMAVGSSPTLSKILRDIFDRPLGKNRKLVSEICERLSRMMTSPDTGEHVPQIWGVITLLLRSKRFDIELWPHFREWVLVLQKCFNCSDLEIKSKAIGNWNRFVLVVNINHTTSRTLLRMLIKPILSQFERKKHDRQNSQPSQLIVASYYNLLYYAFRPDASHEQFDLVWEEYIASPSSNIFTLVPSLSDRLSQALSHMLWNSHSLKPWSENRVNEPKKIGAEELPPLDCKWVRSRIPAILKVFEDILRSSVWIPEMGKSNIAVAWTNLSHALAFAASKEITPSLESMQTVAHVLGLLQRLWNAGPSSLNALEGASKETFFERFGFLSTTMVTALGSIPFTEKLLLKTADSTYQASNTPTHRHSKSNNNPDSPIFHLLRLVSDVPGISEPTPCYHHLIHGIVESACHGKATRSSRLDILRQCASLHSIGYASTFNAYDCTQVIWRSAAQLAADCLSSFPVDSVRERNGSFSRDHVNVVQILSSGLNSPVDHTAWDELVGAFIRLLRTEKGNSTVATMVLEPLAGLLQNRDVAYAYFPASSMFKHSLSMPFTGFIEPETKTHPDSRMPAFPSTLLALTHRLLRESYQVLGQVHLDGVVILIGSIASFLASGTFPFTAILLERLGESLGVYLKDTSRKLTSDSGVEERISAVCRALTTAILGILQRLPSNALTLQRFDQIICSGLESSHAPTANRFREYCISTFGIHQPLLYPSGVFQALRNIRFEIEGRTPQTIPTGANQPTAGSLDATSNDISTKSRISFILDTPAGPSHSTSLESLPVTADAENTAVTSGQTEAKQQQHPKNTSQTLTNEQEVDSSTIKDTKRHSEMFSMIANLRSSSPPAATPRELGFMTPPRLHSLRNEDSEPDTPQTPIIPAVTADNEDGFLGSSPTPAIRGRTPSVVSAIHPAFATAADAMDIDPPSSPPEPEAQSMASRQETPLSSAADQKPGNSRKKKNKSKRAKQVNKKVSRDVSPLKLVNKNDENGIQQTLRSRLRSADKTPTKNEVASAKKEQGSAKAVSGNPKHNSATTSSLENRPNVGPRHHENPLLERADLAMDSASEDTDTQATSQLEHDLVSAVDLGSDAAEKELPQSSNAASTNRKRKREADTSTPSKKDRRRSSRISGTAAPMAEIEESPTTRSKKQKLATSQEILSSPVASATKNPNQTTHDAGEPSTHEAAEEQNSEKQTDKSSQIRRSFRISGVPAPDFPEDTPTPKSLPQPRSSQKRNKRKERRASRRRSQAASGASKQEVNTAKESPKKAVEDPPPTDTNNINLEPETNISLSTADLVTQPEQEAELPKEPEDIPMVEVQETAELEAPLEQEDTPLPRSLEKEIEVEESAGPAETYISPAPQEPEQQPELAPELEHQVEPEQALQRSKDVGITTSLRNLLDQVKLASLDRDTVKEMDDLLFDLRVEMHEALRRHRDVTASTTHHDDQHNNIREKH